MLVEQQLHGLGDQKAFFPVSCELETCLDVLERQLRIVLEDFVLRHPRCKPLENVVNRDSQASDAWLPRTLLRVDCDDFRLFHVACYASSFRDEFKPQFHIAHFVGSLITYFSRFKILKFEIQPEIYGERPA